MIYAKLTNGQTLIILEPGNFDRLRVGKPAISPDESIVISFTPDMRYTAGEIEKAVAEKQMDGERLGRIIFESLKRPEIHEREYEPKRVL